jgi:hypothetical protein
MRALYLKGENILLLIFFNPYAGDTDLFSLMLHSKIDLLCLTSKRQEQKETE